MIRPESFLKNNGCDGNCTEENRPEGICQKAKGVRDSLPLRCVGNWALDKIDYLENYFSIFASSMKFKWQGNLNYIEICSGPGRCILRNEAKEFPGTAMTVLENKNFAHIKRAVFVDRSPQVVAILNQRIRSLGPEISAKAIAIEGDYTNPAGMVAGLSKAGVQTNSLNLVFIDPTDCSVPFNTMRYLNEHLGKTDFIVNFPFGMDMNRNIKIAILEPTYAVSEKYLSFLGDPTFFSSSEVIEAAKKEDSTQLRELMNDKYFSQLAGLGYTHSKKKKIKSYYYLCFFSSNPRGAEFWEKATKHTPDGQQDWGF